MIELDVPVAPPMTGSQNRQITPITKAKKLWDVLYNWRELWLWPAFALGIWYFLVKLATVASGRAPQESLDFLVGLGANVVTCVIAISLVSILRESTGVWWSKEDLKQNPIIACESALFRLGAFLALLWALKH